MPRLLFSEPSSPRSQAPNPVYRFSKTKWWGAIGLEVDFWSTVVIVRGCVAYALLFPMLGLLVIEA